MITALTLYLTLKLTLAADYTWLTEVKPVVRIEATEVKVVR